MITGFNGATIFRSWRHSQLSCDEMAVSAVSMEPRSFDHGDNDAAFMVFEASEKLAFQWSHDLSIMETQFRRTTRMAAPGTRFNGATIFRSWRRGDRHAPLPLQGGRFQWSHDLSIMETAHVMSILTSKDEFQWSHDLSIMETFFRSNGRFDGTGVVSFNGATIFRSWRPIRTWLGW